MDALQLGPPVDEKHQQADWAFTWEDIQKT